MAQSTFNPSFDGTAARGTAVNETFATIRAGSGTHTNVTANEFLHLHGNLTTDHFDYNFRYVVNFDTSGLPDGAVITAATFDVYVTSHPNNEGMTNVALVAPTPASTSAIANADYNIANWPATRMATDIAIADFVNSQRNVFTLNAAGLAAINKTGITTFGLIFSNDVDGGSATWQSDNDSLLAGDFSGDTNKPQLIVTYTTGSASASASASASGSASLSPSASSSASASSSESKSSSASSSASSSNSLSPSSSTSASASSSESASASASQSSSSSSSASASLSFSASQSASVSASKSASASLSPSASLSQSASASASPSPASYTNQYSSVGNSYTDKYRSTY